MTSEQMKCFIKVAETGSFTEAAERLFLTQPSLSKKIAALETELGISLFNRDKSKKTHLTPAGELVYQGFVKMMDEYDSLLRQAKSIAEGRSGVVRIGLFENQKIDPNLKHILNGFSVENPDVDIHITTNTFDGLIRDIRNGKLDCAVTIGYDLMSREKIPHLHLYDIASFLVIPNSLIREKKADYSLMDFAGCPFLTIDEEQNLFQNRMIREELSSRGITPHLVMATDDKHFNLLLEMGKGIAILDQYNKGCDALETTCIQVPEIQAAPFELAWGEEPENPAFLLFLKYVKSRMN